MKATLRRKAGMLSLFLGLCACVGIALGTLTVKTAAIAAEYSPETVYESVVTEDAYVRDSKKTTNYTSEAITEAHGAQYVGKGYRVINVKHKTGNEIFALMKFALPSSQEAETLGIDTFVLQFSVFKNADYQNGDQEYIFCFTTENGWSENTITWNNKPSSIVRDSEKEMAVLAVEKGYEYETKTDEEKTVRLDVTDTVRALIEAGEDEVTVFAYAKNDLETSLLIHAKETSEESKRARILGIKENVDAAQLEALAEEVSQLDENKYTAESYAALETAYEEALGVLAQTEPAQQDVVAAFKALYAAYGGLVVRDGENIAYGKTARSNLNKSNVYKVTDGNDGTYWTGIFYPSYVDVDLGDNYDIDKITVVFPGSKKIQYSLYASTDGAEYDRIAQVREGVSGTSAVQFQTPVRGRIVRVYLESTQGDNSAYLSEVKVYGTMAGGNSGALREGTLEDILGVQAYGETEYAEPITEAEIIENVYGIIDRTVGSQYRSWFTFSLTEQDSAKDFYTIQNDNGKIHISGNEGLSLTTGLNYYFKNYLNIHISEQTMQVKMPAAVVPVENTVRNETDYSVRYAYNYCTLSYTYAFYDAEDWQRVYDWLALNGVNVVLDLAGQEATWILFLMNYGYSFDDAKDWISGPAYSAWQFMSNMEAFGGPVSDQYIVNRIELARSTQRWKNSLGMQTVLQGYAGMVPTNFNEFQPDVGLVDQGTWNGFDRPSMIATDSATYDEYAAKFYECQEFVYGKNNHYYAVDPFHEGGKRPSGLSDSTIAENVLESLLKYDDSAVWVVQGWQSNPTNGLLQGMGGYRNTNVLVVDLIKYPISSGTKYDDTKYGSTTLSSKEFNGTNWAWTLLANFGGNPSMHGELETMVEDILRAKRTSTYMQGIGIISEAMNDNPVVYDLLFDLVWADDTFDLSAWLDKYVERRYGGTSENVRRAWEIMKDSNYNYGVRFTSEVYGMKNKGPQGYGKQSIAYGTENLETALRLMLTDFERFKNSECYLYDLSDIMRQVVSNFSTMTYNDILTAKEEKDIDAFMAAKEKFLKSLEVLNDVQATRQDQLAGEWIGKATDMAAKYDDFSVDLFEMQAKALITSWGSRNSNRNLKDYGWRNYEGMFTDLYAEIWTEYLNKVEQNIRTGASIQNISIDGYFDIYWQWNLSETQYLREAKDSPEEVYAVSQEVLQYCMLGGEADPDMGNVALGRAVSVTGNADGWSQYATDGEDETSFSLLPVSGKAELIVDLIGEFQLSKVQAVFGGGEYGFELYTSADGEEWTLAGEFASEGEGEYALNGVTARFVKIASDAAMTICEVRAYGERGLPDLTQLGRLVAAADDFKGGDAQFESAYKAASDALRTQAPPDTVISVYWALYDAMAAQSESLRENLAQGKPVEAHNDPSGNSGRLTDGDTTAENYWDSGRLSPTGKPYQDEISPGWAIVDLGEEYDVNGIKLLFYDTSLWYNYEIYVSADGQDWTKVCEKTDKQQPSASGDNLSFAAVRGRYVKIVTTNISLESSGKRAGYRIIEMEVYGSKPAAVDKTELLAAIAAAEALRGENYTESSFAALTGALAEAKQVAENAQATQAEIDAALSKLNGAAAALEEAQSGPAAGGEEPGDTDQGADGDANQGADGGDDAEKTGCGGTAAASGMALAALSTAAAAVLVRRKKN